MIFAGPPTRTIASLISSTVRFVQLIALGWGLNTMLLPAAIMQMALPIGVVQGAVEGVMHRSRHKAALLPP